METKTLSALALEIALSQLGVQEHPKGSNDGPEVRKYLASVGLGPGNAWCLAGAYWCVDQAAKRLGLPNPLVKTGSVKYLWEHTKLPKIPARASYVRPGSIFIHINADGTGHAGLVVEKSDNLIHSIDGNTNQDGSREGYEWCQHARPVTYFAGFVQLP